ncbi:MAG: quinone oxidoreductase [Bacteroidota bacterium]|jgi:NAD(P)H dehydrogenase (quinone)|nr:quinone oxidoreductase [Bacteroidota bacterium]
MKVFIVHAHPEPLSFNSALKDEAVKILEVSGHEVQVSDLYAMRFDPVGGKADFKSLTAPDYFKYQAEQLNAFNNDLFSEELKAEMEKLEWADLVIFNFPLWWFSLPAILKGWVDRVFAMGFAYGGGKGVYDNGIFKGKKGMLCITTGGPEIAYGPNGKNGELEKILYSINHGIFYFVGMDALEPHIVFSPARLTEEERNTQLLKYKNVLLKIEDVKCITF